MCWIPGRQKQSELSKETEENITLLNRLQDIEDDNATQGTIIKLNMGRQWKKNLWSKNVYIQTLLTSSSKIVYISCVSYWSLINDNYTYVLQLTVVHEITFLIGGLSILFVNHNKMYLSIMLLYAFFCSISPYVHLCGCVTIVYYWYNIHQYDIFEDWHKTEQ